MYYITGDTHRNFERIQYFCDRFNTSKDDVLIILGDVCLNYYLNELDKEVKKEVSKLPITLFCIKGNHEKYPDTLEGYKLKEWNEGQVFYEKDFPNILFAKDGDIYNINNNKCLVIGGAYSVDKYYRIENGYEWFEDEQPNNIIKNYVYKQLNKNDWNIDVVLSHTCPFDVMPKHLFVPNLNQSNVDNSTEEWFQEIANNLNFSKWYFGHFHGEWKIGKYELLFEDIKEFES